MQVLQYIQIVSRTHSHLEVDIDTGDDVPQHKIEQRQAGQQQAISIHEVHALGGDKAVDEAARYVWCGYADGLDRDCQRAVYDQQQAVPFEIFAATANHPHMLLLAEAEPIPQPLQVPARRLPRRRQRCGETARAHIYMSCSIPRCCP